LIFQFDVSQSECDVAQGILAGESVSIEDFEKIHWPTTDAG
jgi:hypothetical protein